MQEKTKRRCEGILRILRKVTGPVSEYALWLNWHDGTSFPEFIQDEISHRSFVRALQLLVQDERVIEFTRKQPKHRKGRAEQELYPTKFYWPASR